MKTDADLKRDVLDELAWEPSVKEQDIGISVRDGIVTVTGNVPTYTQKLATETAIKRVAGVRAIAEELSVSLLGGYQRDDVDIAQAAANALDWDVSVPRSHVKVMVESGWVTLSGDVEWHYQRQAAHNAVRHLTGVTGMTDFIQVKSTSMTTTDVSSKIEAVLRRSVIKDVDTIIVEADNGKVTLRGKVHSWRVHDDAVRIAWSTPGVSAVKNDLKIMYE